MVSISLWNLMAAIWICRRISMGNHIFFFFNDLFIRKSIFSFKYTLKIDKFWILKRKKKFAKILCFALKPVWVLSIILKWITNFKSSHSIFAAIAAPNLISISSKMYDSLADGFRCQVSGISYLYINYKIYIFFYHHQIQFHTFYSLLNAELYFIWLSLNKYCFSFFCLL